MPRRNFARISVAVVAAVAFAACSGESPVAPGATPDGVRDLSLLAQAVEGSYELTVYATDFGEVILQAHVFEPVSGEPAQGGVVIFQVCVREGLSYRMVLPSEECEAGGSGAWVNLPAILPVNPGTCPGLGLGYACLDFGIVRTATVGFRFRYIGQGSGIANGVSLPKDYVPAGVA